MMRNVANRGTPIAIALCLLAAPAQAQEEAPGWIGISFDIRTTGSQRRAETTVIITDVSSGSPADEAGIRAGDRLLQINDLNRASELRDIGERLRLRSGDRVRVVLEREGRRREIRLRAVERPVSVATAPRFAMEFEPDSVVETIMRAMDSLRVRLSLRPDARIRRVTVEGVSENEPEVFVSGDARWAKPPFEFFVFGGDQRDSLAREMEEVNEVMARFREMEGERLREISRTAGRLGGLDRSEDVELRRVRETLEQLSGRSDEIRATMVEVARENAGLRYVASPLDVNGPPPVGEAEAPPEFRPLTPYLLGRNRVAGAEVIDLRPELAEYFRVEGGVLVVDVPRGTPANMAGILPGDVVTRIDQVVVRSVEDLRFGVAQAGDTLPISLIRQGLSIQVLLRR